VNSGPATLPNPAAIFYAENGGKFEIRKATDGSQSGVCILSDGREVDAWQFFRQNTKIKWSVPTGCVASLLQSCTWRMDEIFSCEDAAADLSGRQLPAFG
jgi:hypothetical protein